MLSTRGEGIDLARHLSPPLGIITTPGSRSRKDPLSITPPSNSRSGQTHQAVRLLPGQRRDALGSRAVASTAISLSEGGRKRPALIAGGPCAASTASFSVGSARR